MPNGTVLPSSITPEAIGDTTKPPRNKPVNGNVFNFPGCVSSRKLEAAGGVLPK